MKRLSSILLGALFCFLLFELCPPSTAAQASSEQLDDIKERIGEVKSDVKSLNNKFDQLNNAVIADVTTLKIQMSNMENVRMKNLENRIDNLLAAIGTIGVVLLGIIGKWALDRFGKKD